MKLHLRSKWDETTGIPWANEYRKDLNKIIDCFNAWQMKDNFSQKKSKTVLANIKHGKQSIGRADGGRCYMDELNLMEKHVRFVLRHK